MFTELELSRQTVEHIWSMYIEGKTAQELSNILKAQGKSAPAKQFTKMNKNVYDEMKKVIRKINDDKKRKINDDKKTEQPRWRKLLRLDTG